MGTRNRVRPAGLGHKLLILRLLADYKYSRPRLAVSRGLETCSGLRILTRAKQLALSGLPLVATRVRPAGISPSTQNFFSQKILVWAQARKIFC